jgi:hypothetical protein
MDRKKIAWRDQAKAQLRAIDQPTCAFSAPWPTSPPPARAT